MLRIYIDMLKRGNGKTFSGSFDLTQNGGAPPRNFGDEGWMEPPAGKHWIWSQERIDEALRKGLIFFTKNDYAIAKKYLEERDGNPVQDIWNDKSVQPV